MPEEDPAMHLIKLGQDCEVSLSFIKLQSMSLAHEEPICLKHTNEEVESQVLSELSYPLGHAGTALLQVATGQLSPLLEELDDAATQD